jgi:hypothetical protein
MDNHVIKSNAARDKVAEPKLRNRTSYLTDRVLDSLVIVAVAQLR